MGRIACLHHNKVLLLHRDPETSDNCVHCDLGKVFSGSYICLTSATPLPALLCVCYLFVPIILAFVQESDSFTCSINKSRKKPDMVQNVQKPAQGSQDFKFMICTLYSSVLEFSPTSQLSSDIYWLSLSFSIKSL